MDAPDITTHPDGQKNSQYRGSMDLLHNLEMTALSMDDLRRMLGPEARTTRVMEYDDLRNVGRAEELFRNERITVVDVSPIGERALVAIGAGAGESHPISVMLNWTEVLKGR